MTDVDSTIEGGGNYEYLTRSLAIVTLLYERGILQELIEAGKITQDEIELRVSMIREKYRLYQEPEPGAPEQE